MCNGKKNNFFIFKKKIFFFFSSSLIQVAVESARKDSQYQNIVDIILAFRSPNARINCTNDQSNVFEDRSYLFLKHHGRETTRGTERGCA